MDEDDDIFIHIEKPQKKESNIKQSVVNTSTSTPWEKRKREDRTIKKKKEKQKLKKEKKDENKKDDDKAIGVGILTQRFQPTETSHKAVSSTAPAPVISQEKENDVKVTDDTKAQEKKPDESEVSSKKTKRMREKEKKKAEKAARRSRSDGSPLNLIAAPVMRDRTHLFNQTSTGMSTNEFGDAKVAKSSMIQFDEFGTGNVSMKPKTKQYDEFAWEDNPIKIKTSSENIEGKERISKKLKVRDDDDNEKPKKRRKTEQPVTEEVNDDITVHTTDTMDTTFDSHKEDEQAEKKEKKEKKKKWRGCDKEAPEVDTSVGPDVKIKESGSDELFSGKDFSTVEELDAGLVRQLKYRDFNIMTDVQSKAIPACLKGKDVMIKAPTGSGKTLSFLVPMLSQMIAKGKTERSNGTRVIILSPTKELCVQSHNVCMKLTNMAPWIVSCQISGGENPKSEKSRLRKGVHVVFATPGRIIYHLEQSSGWKMSQNMDFFIMDEADRLLDLGFEKQVKQIYEKTVKSRGGQTLLVSATLTDSVKKLGEFCLQEDHEFVGGKGEESDQWTIPSTLKQWCVMFPAKQRLQGLISLLLEKKGKSIVFFSSCAEVDFHYDLFQEVRWPEMPTKKDKKPTVRTVNMGNGFVGIEKRGEEDIDIEEENSDRPRIFSSLKVFKLHGDLKSEERNGFIADFSKIKNGVLLASDVAARGIDLPALDWIIQYDPPRQIEEYLHRVGRTARMGRAGDSCLFLQQHEVKYSDLLKEKGVVITNMDGEAIREGLRMRLPNHDPLLKIRDLASFVGAAITKHVEARPLLHQVARRAFSSWMRAYQTFPRDLKPIFNFKALHSGHVAASFALGENPNKVMHTLKKEAEHEKERSKGEGKGADWKVPRKQRFKTKKFNAVDEFM